MNTIARTRRAFSLAELLVVISIIVLLVAIAVPAFSSMVAGSERTLAENQLRVGLSAGRDAAIRSDSGDGAAAFFFTPGGRVTIIPCVQVGTITDYGVYTAVGQPDNTITARRDIFVPIPNIEPIQLPRGWSIRAFTPPDSVDSNNANGVPSNGWYERYAGRAAEGNWIFPESGFMPVLDATGAPRTDLGSKGYARQSFIVRFTNGSGELATGDRRLALVVDPINSAEFRAAPPLSTNRIDNALDLPSFVRRLAARTDLTQDHRSQLLGDISPDTVLCRPVTEIAIYKEASLATAVQARGLNRVTGTLYADPRTTLPEGTARLDVQLFGGALNESDVNRDIGLWLQGRLLRNGGPVASDASVFTLAKYLGHVQEIKP